MIGLHQGTVDIIPHQGDWRDAFEAERAKIIASATGLIADLQHVGSTAVPDLDAKPIIDMALAVTSSEVMPQLLQQLASIGWIDRGDKGDFGGHLFVKESAPRFRTHHLHVVPIRSSQWRNYIEFRDLLLQKQEVRSRYAQLKNELKARFSDDRASYTLAKEEFIASILETKKLNN